eukprot:maker-scaffold564_size136232-snap-gene-0.38 protein:Tk11655 transcript:maker-scaffold564_size136232-snap-gene-0.38-mRNA-1 annotation:"PREDICTED: uncharacterized protein K02A2.6-like"
MVMKNLHDSHQGIHRTRSRARNLYYWPGLNNGIAQLIESCDECQQYKPSQIREEKIGHWIPDRQFQAISADLCENQLRMVKLIKKNSALEFLNGEMYHGQMMEHRRRNGSSDVHFGPVFWAIQRLIIAYWMKIMLRD